MSEDSRNYGRGTRLKPERSTLHSEASDALRRAQADRKAGKQPDAPAPPGTVRMPDGSLMRADLHARLEAAEADRLERERNWQAAQDRIAARDTARETARRKAADDAAKVPDGYSPSEHAAHLADIARQSRSRADVIAAANAAVACGRLVREGCGWCNRSTDTHPFVMPVNPGDDPMTGVAWICAKCEGNSKGSARG